MLSDLAFSGGITDTDVMTAAALVIILRRFMVSFPPDASERQLVRLDGAGQTDPRVE
jgi:hypothetical protein